ncbi:sodium:solute symporter family protein [Leptospira sp. GIMC2001]|uniref:sodium:solute symporter family protein n=1 Tax=Leptospira sp. GIMC2001 TaxID=1513297 RepID=UPI0023498C7B|nr:hypothetical protein [Leptospira sp. GIMC2001]WCL47539.1 hypothetical protein O4O04_00805 [Leptospira sp. GIMC2001]
MNIDLAIFAIYIVLLLTIGLWKSVKVQSELSYLLANRSTGLFALVATLVMTEFNTSTLLGFSSVGAIAGLWGLWLPSVFLFGLLFYAVVVAKKWKQFNGFSTAGFFTMKYGSKFGKIASACLLVAMLGFSATYIKSLVLLFSPMLACLTEWESSLIFVLIVLAFTLRGGLVSVIRTDIFGFMSVLVLIPALAFFVWINAEGGFSSFIDRFPISKSQEDLSFAYIASLIVLTMFTYISAPWYSQKIFSAKSEKTAYLSVVIAAVIVFLLYGFPVIATGLFALTGIENSNPQMSIPLIIQHFLPLGWKGFAYGVLFVAASTTLAGVWSAMTTMAISDFLKHSDAKVGISRSIYITIFFAFFSWLSANLIVDNILNKLILANIPVAALSFALLGGFYWKKTNFYGAIASVIVGIVWGIFSYYYWQEEGGYTIYWVFIGIPIIFATGGIGSLLTSNRTG